MKRLTVIEDLHTYLLGPRRTCLEERARHELRRHREGYRRPRREGQTQSTGNGGHGWWNIHDLERRRLRIALWNPHHQPSAIGHPRDARDF